MKTKTILATILLLLASAAVAQQTGGGGGVPGGSSGGPPTGAASNCLTGTYPGPGLSSPCAVSGVAGQTIAPLSVVATNDVTAGGNLVSSSLVLLLGGNITEYGGYGNGVLALLNGSSTALTRLDFGTNTSSSIALCMSGTALSVCGGDGSAVGSFTAPSVAAGNGFSGTKTAGSCVFTIASGIITNVTGC